MSKPIDQEREVFAREDRYIVIKLSDLAKIPAEVGIPFSEQLTAIQRRFPNRECLVIESDWPEFQVAWGMIEARMTGKQPEGVAVQDGSSSLTDRLARFLGVVRGCERLASDYSGSLDRVDEHGGDDHEDPICAVFHRLYYAMFDGDKLLKDLREALAAAPHPVSGEQPAAQDVRGMEKIIDLAEPLIDLLYSEKRIRGDGNPPGATIAKCERLLDLIAAHRAQAQGGDQ